MFEPVFERLWFQLSFGIQVAWNPTFWKEYLPGLWTVPFYALPGYLYHPPAGSWRRKRHFEATNVPILANEDVFKA